jgi:hypothetical protein
MKFTSLLTNLILEQSRFKVLYDKIVLPSKKEGQPSDPKSKKKGIMDFETLKTIIFADPTTKAPENFNIEGASVQDMETVKVGKYTQWLLKNFIAPTFSDERADVEKGGPEYKRMMVEYQRLFMEDLYKTTDDLKKFEKAKQYLPQEQRDINKFTYTSLFDTLKDFQIPEKKMSEIQKKEAKKSREGLKHAGGEILFEGPNWTLIRISGGGEVGKDAAIYYGGFHEYDMGESRWCTSSPGLTYFDGYVKDGPLYVIFPNDDKGQVGKKTGLPMERYQFHFPSNQFMDRHDRGVDLVDLLNGPMNELKEFFKPEFAKGLSSKGNTSRIEINYPESSAGKFVALYGFEELFENLPDTIEQLIINNKSKENIALDVPDSIGRFTQLNSLLLRNLVKTLPDTIGNLKELSFLSLPDNPNLKNLPESISNLNNLILVLIKGSSNVKLPKSMEGRMTEQSEGLYFTDNG